MNPDGAIESALMWCGIGLLIVAIYLSLGLVWAFTAAGLCLFGGAAHYTKRTRDCPMCGDGTIPADLPKRVSPEERKALYDALRNPNGGDGDIGAAGRCQTGLGGGENDDAA